MPIIDTIDDILNVHEQQGKPRSLIDLMRDVRLGEHEIDRAGYRTEVAVKRKSVLRDEVVSLYVVEVRRLQAERAQAGVGTMSAFNATLAAAKSNGTSAPVNVNAIVSAPTVAEIGL